MRWVGRLRLIYLCAAILVFCSAVPTRAADLGDKASPLFVTSWMRGDDAAMRQGGEKKIFVIEFWATWCAPCRISLPRLGDLHRKFQAQGVVVAAITDEPREKAEAFLKQLGVPIEFLVGLDGSRRTHEGFLKAYGIGALPYSFLVDKSGAVVWHGHPLMGLDQAVEELIAGRFDLEAARKAVLLHPLFQQYLLLAQAGTGRDRANQLGEQLVLNGALNPILMNELAWAILEDPTLRFRDLPLALRAAERANQGTGETNAVVLDTLARALFENHRPADAVHRAEQALAQTSDLTVRRSLELAIKRYQAGVPVTPPAGTEKPPQRPP